MRRLILVSLSLIATSCVAMTTMKVSYDLGLAEVERPANAKIKYGQQVVTKVKEEGVERYVFEDGMVRILWIPSPSHISFTLTNKTDHSIKILWDEASYIDSIGHGHRVIHSGVKFSEKNNPQAPSIIPRKTSFNDLVYPSDLAEYLGGTLGWYEGKIFNITSQLLKFDSDYGRQEFQEDSKKIMEYDGKEFQVLMPLQIEDVKSEYIFRFRFGNISINPEEATTKSP